MCATCGKPVPYRSGQRYCSRNCYLHRRVVQERTTLAEILADLNHGKTVGQVAELIGVTRPTLYRILHEAHIERLAGSPGHPGCYGWVRPRKPT